MVNKPTVGQTGWGPDLNAALDELEAAEQSNDAEQQVEIDAAEAALATKATLISDVAVNLPIYQYGNSYAAYTINSGTTYFDRLIQKLDTPVHGNWGIPATLAADQCSYMYGTFTAAVQFLASSCLLPRTTGAGTWTQPADPSAGSNGVVILECVRNDAGLDAVTANGGTTAKSRAGFVNALDAMIRMVRAKSRVENTVLAGWSETGVWTNASGFAGCSGSNIAYTTAVGAKRTITIGGDCDLILLGIDDSGFGTAGAAYEVKIDGTTFATGTTADQHRKTGFTSGLTAGGNYGFGQMAVPLRGLEDEFGAGPYTLEVIHAGSAGQMLAVDCLLAPRDDTAFPPPTIIIPKNPEFSEDGYQSYIDLGGTNASRETDLIYNDLIDQVIARFPEGEVIAWDPMEHGFDPDIHVGNKDGADVHLNDAGAEFYADGLFELINSLEARDGLVRV